MRISPPDAWTFGRVLCDQPLNGELDALAEPWKTMAAHLAAMAVADRQAHWQAMLAARLDHDELIKALADVDPLGPAPAPEAGLSFATLADVALVLSAQEWLWRSWLAVGVLNALASDPGIGKTRFAMDIARRLYFGLPWPDGQPNTCPGGTRTLWVQGDQNFAEMLQVCRDFGISDNAVVLGSASDDPFGSLDLDDPDTLVVIGKRAKASGVRLIVVDTIGMCTSRNLAKPEEAREFFQPIMELCRQSEIVLWALTHLSANGNPLGRRIVEKARVLHKMTQPDPEGRPDRRRLWVDKTAVIKPPPLGITMGNTGNDYDFEPPKEPDLTPRKRGPVPEKLEECKEWLTKYLTPNPARVVDIRAESEKAGFAAATLYGARNSLMVEEFNLERRKWWRLPPVSVVSDKPPDNSDNSDKVF
jgi:hypothetical protein